MNDGPRHDYLLTGKRDQIKAKFDPHGRANIEYGRLHMGLDFDRKVHEDFRDLEQNWRSNKDFSIDLQMVVNNPVTQVMTHAGGYQQKALRTWSWI